MPVDPTSRRFAALVVDDEEDSLLEIRDLLVGDPRLAIAGAHSDPSKALKESGQQELDCAFIDIKMPGMNGFELGERLMQRHPGLLIVYVTAFNDYASEAFEINAVDYVLKPVRKERLRKSVDRVVALMQATRRSKEAAGPEGPDHSVEVRCFGRLELLMDGVLVHWHTKKSAELFAYLLHHRDRFVSKDRIVEDLWPDQGYENALVNLHTTVYRTRRTLDESGGRLSLDFEDGRYRMRMADVRCDVEEFERAFEQGRTFQNEGATMAPLERAVRMYKGDYLEEMSYIWSIDLQESLRRRYVVCLKSLASLHLSGDSLAKAIPLLETAVAKDPYDEDAYDLLFKAYRLAKDVRSMLAFYEKTRGRLKDGLGNAFTQLMEQRLLDSYREITGRNLK